MNDRKDATDAPLTAPGKCRLASSRIKEKYGNLAALDYDAAVMNYVTQGKEPESLEGFMSVAWPHTKAMIDEDKTIDGKEPERSDGDRPFKDFMDSLKDIDRKRIAEEREKLALFADRLGADVDDLESFLRKYGEVFSVESYREEVEKGGEWESYEEYVGSGLTAFESRLADAQYRFMQQVDEVEMAESKDENQIWLCKRLGEAARDYDRIIEKLKSDELFAALDELHELEEPETPEEELRVEQLLETVERLK